MREYTKLCQALRHYGRTAAGVSADCQWDITHAKYMLERACDKGLVEVDKMYTSNAIVFYKLKERECAAISPDKNATAKTSVPSVPMTYPMSSWELDLSQENSTTNTLQSVTS
jgi:hypothetical protein